MQFALASRDWEVSEVQAAHRQAVGDGQDCDAPGGGAAKGEAVKQMVKEESRKVRSDAERKKLKPLKFG